MREVAWVVFDEIHYMRDKCKPLHLRSDPILTVDAISSWCGLGGDYHPSSR